MFRRTRERFERLERSLEQITTLLQQREAPAPRGDVAETLAKVFAAQAGSQVDLVNAFGEIAVRSARRNAGIRGGRARTASARRDENGRLLPNPNSPRSRAVARVPECPLCLDPNYRAVDIPMIQAHRQHEAARMAGARRVQEEEEHVQPTRPDDITNTGPAIDPFAGNGNGAGN
jgi:hypothetical protein